jgi:cyclic pyranopterin phosphate synthase
MSELTHFRDGSPQMVDVSEKTPTRREAVAEAFVRLPTAAINALEQGGVGKGDPLTVAQLAGIMAAKRTSELIPLCHPIPLSSLDVKLERVSDGVHVTSRVRTTDRTGVEMEALTAASVAALTVYDMLKAVSKGIVIERLRLLSKTGGKSGDWHAEDGV